VVIVRVLLLIALATLGAALLLYAVRRDPRYLRFVWLTAKLTLLLLAVVLVGYAIERLFLKG
jgi:hypothetical protein